MRQHVGLCAEPHQYQTFLHQKRMWCCRMARKVCCARSVCFRACQAFAAKICLQDVRTNDVETSSSSLGVSPLGLLQSKGCITLLSPCNSLPDVGTRKSNFWQVNSSGRTVQKPDRHINAFEFIAQRQISFTDPMNRRYICLSATMCLCAATTGRAGCCFPAGMASAAAALGGWQAMSC